MATTTSYGTWYNHTGSNLTVEADVADFIGGGPSEWVAQCEATGALEKMVDAYRAAINAALPEGVSLAGDEFYGPAYEEDYAWEGELDLAEIIQGIDLGDIVDEHDPDNETYDAEHGYIAAIGTAGDVVAGSHADLCVAEAEVVGYSRDNEGDETPETVMGTVITSPVELDVRVDDEDLLHVVEGLADAKLAELGWNRTGEWEIADNALYAPVERA